MPKKYKNVGNVGHCLILSKVEDVDSSDNEILAFFAVFMMNQDGKPACCLEEAKTLQRISPKINNFDGLVPFCQGYSMCVQERRNYKVAPEEWLYKKAIDVENVETPSDKEILRLRAYPHKIQ